MLLWTSKTHTASDNKWKQLLTVTLFILILSFPPISFIFWPTHHLLTNTSSSKLWRPITTTFCVPCTTTWNHVTSSLWMNALDFIFRLFYIHNPLKLIILTPCHSPCMPSINYVNTSVNYVNTFVTILILLLIVPINPLIMPTHLMTTQIHLLIQLMPLIHQL